MTKSMCMSNTYILIVDFMWRTEGLFKAYPRLAKKFKFIKGLVHNLQKTDSHTLVL